MNVYSVSIQCQYVVHVIGLQMRHDITQYSGYVVTLNMTFLLFTLILPSLSKLYNKKKNPPKLIAFHQWNPLEIL